VSKWDYLLESNVDLRKAIKKYQTTGTGRAYRELRSLGIEEFLDETRDIELRKRERAWKVEPRDVKKAVRYARALVRTGGYLDTHTSPETGIAYRAEIRGEEFPADVPFTVRGVGPRSEYYFEEYALPLVSGMVRVMTRVRERLPGTRGVGHRYGVENVDESWSGSYRPNRRKGTRIARVSIDTSMEGRIEPEWGGFGRIRVTMRLGDMEAIRTKDWENKDYIYTSEVVMDIRGPSYQIVGKRYRVSGTSVSLAFGARYWDRLTFPSRGYEPSVSRKHKFRNGKEILDLAYAKLMEVEASPSP